MPHPYRWTLILPVLGCLLAGPVPAHASQWHQFDIINNSSRYMSIVGIQGRCVTEVNIKDGLNPGERTTVSWNDSNDADWDCTNRDKYIAFQFYLDGGQSWIGWLGVTHRNLYSNDWYNGQFYTHILGLYTPHNYHFADGNPPPSWIQALCTYGPNACFGSFTQMEDNGKDSYNWPRFHENENGWAFQINEPN